MEASSTLVCNIKYAPRLFVPDLNPNMKFVHEPCDLPLKLAVFLFNSVPLKLWEVSFAKSLTVPQPLTLTLGLWVPASLWRVAQCPGLAASRSPSSLLMKCRLEKPVYL